jgi:glycosyltransferase involved in cell wall biosynthesis
VLHTVLRRPTTSQRRIIEDLGRRGTLVVLSEAARSSLASGYGIPRSTVVVIPHGAHWSAQPPTRGARRELISWGLLGPGKGLERSIRAMPLLRDLDPVPRYRIVGRTHPALQERGVDYRHHLEALVLELGVAHMVRFIDHYLPDDELLKMVAGSDIVVVPYDNDEQVSSGVITEAVAAGRAVVATRFPHAVELLERGAGIVVDHDSAAIAHAIRRFLVDPDTYHRAVSAAADLSPTLSWDASAMRYARLIRSLVPEHALARRV